jgi:hypothetical protein
MFQEIIVHSLRARERLVPLEELVLWGRQDSEEKREIKETRETGEIKVYLAQAVLKECVSTIILRVLKALKV